MIGSLSELLINVGSLSELLIDGQFFIKVIDQLMVGSLSGLFGYWLVLYQSYWLMVGSLSELMINC